MNKWKGVACLVLAMAAMAVVGTGSAQAVKACANGSPEGDGCGTGKKGYSGAVSFSAASWTLTNNVTTVHCSIGAMSITLLGSTGLPLAASLVTLSVNPASCETTSGTACEVTTVNLPYNASIEGTTLTVTDPVGAGFTVKCGFLINCTFTTKEGKGSITSGNPTKVSGTWKMTRSGGFCPETSDWHYSFLSGSPAGFTIV